MKPGLIAGIALTSTLALGAAGGHGDGSKLDKKINGLGSELSTGAKSASNEASGNVKKAQTKDKSAKTKK